MTQPKPPIKLPEKLIVSSGKVFDASDAYHPAGPDYYGFTNPHVALLDGVYDKGIDYAILRKDFEIGTGPERPRSRDSRYFNKNIPNPLLPNTSRGWKTIRDLCEKMPFEEALRIAEESARRENIVLYDDRISNFDVLPFWDPKRILWTPENWRAFVG